MITLGTRSYLWFCGCRHFFELPAEMVNVTAQNRNFVRVTSLKSRDCFVVLVNCARRNNPDVRHVARKINNRLDDFPLAVSCGA